MMADEDEKYKGVLVVEYITKHHFDNKKPKGETYHEEDVTFCCAKMEERWNVSDSSLAIEFGMSEECGYFYTQSSKVGVFMVTKDPGWYGDTSYDHWEISHCPFCGGTFVLREVKKVRVDNTCHTRTRQVKEDYCITKETAIE